MDLRQQLQHTLGDAYVLGRELTGGGMSHVFVAEERALGRTVVVKVLPPASSAGVNIERFKREIHVAARLQNAHIVPVLTAGETEGLPFYTMPFVEGESLRTRLARGPLAINETVSILRDMSRALAYAHERGVVHRDIKPDNVMLSGGSAVVTDFGIAKAIVESRTSEHPATLTQVGTSIGTPTYMAPEQAAGDPQSDHRVDLYAFGCTAYEMLIGQPPFVEKTAQQLLAAHMARDPEPIAARRPDIPAPLADIITRCLAKDAAERPQSAAEIARSLESVTSGGAVPAMPPILLTGKHMLRRALLVYAAAVVFVAVVAKAAIVGIGLPSWVLPGALVVMALGLPVILFTGYVQRVMHRAVTATPTFTPGGTQAHPAGTMATVAMKASPHVSWRRATVGGMIALGAFIVGVGLFMVARAFGIGPAATLLSKGSLTENDRIIIAEFETSAADSGLSAVLAEAMRTSLSRSNRVRIVQTSGIVAALERMQRPPETRIDLGTARGIAQREGLKAIVTGRLTSVGTGYLVSVQLLAAANGDVLASAQAPARDATELIGTIDKLGKGLRERIGESLRDVQNAPALAKVITPSTEALRKFTEGSRYNDLLSDNAKAVEALREAIHLDTNFAMAYRKLAVSLGSLGRRAEARNAIAHAFTLRDRMPEAERLALLGVYYERGPEPDRNKVIANYEQLFAKYPEWLQLITTDLLATAYEDRHEFAKAESLWAVAVRVAPDEDSPHRDIVRAQVAQGKFDAAMRSIVLGRARRPSTQFLTYEAAIHYERGRRDSARIVLQRAFDAKSTLTNTARTSLNNLDVIEGRIDATRTRTTNPAADPNNTIAGARIALFIEGREDEAERRIDAYLKSRPPSVPVITYALPAANVLSSIGRAERARALVKQYQATADTIDQANRRAITFALGAIAQAEGRFDEAIAKYRASDRLPDGPATECQICIDVAVGSAFDRAGKADSAIAFFEHFLRTPTTARLAQDAPVRPWILRRLGELYEKQNKPEKALEYYRQFVDLWRNADPSLQPQVADVRGRIQRIEDALRRKG